MTTVMRASSWRRWLQLHWQNVASNTSANANAGVYLRPWHDDFRQLQTGLSVSWMDFSKNLSYFTYGQGGYFSPRTMSACRCLSISHRKSITGS
jgi:hypothetical protein